MVPFPLINPLVADVGSPPIPEAHGWIARYDGSYGSVINLSQAVPGTHPHPDLLVRLGKSAGAPASTRYGAIEGDEDLRKTYSGHLSQAYGSSIGPADVAITAGCNMAFFATMMLLARQGDAVLLPTPWYFNHQMSLDMLGIEPRPLPCRMEAGFVPDAADAERLIDSRVRAVVLVTPNNPTGAVYPASVIEAFADFCRRRGIVLVLDETYRDFLPPGVSCAHGLFRSADWRGTVIQLYSFSKSYAIPGHRAGAVTADATHIAQLGKILDCIQICAPRAVQGALPWAIDGLRDWREANRAEINRRIEVFRAALAPLTGWRIASIGAYFAYLRHPFAGSTGREVAERLAAERGVLCLPGSFFGPGQEGHLRMAFANVGAQTLEHLTVRLQGLTV